MASSALAVIAGPKERRSQPDFRRAFLNGDGIIVRHSHRQRIQLQLRMTSRVLIAQLAETPEVRPHRLGISQIRRHSHQAANPKMSELGQPLQHLVYFCTLGGDAALGFLFAQFDFEQYRQRSPAD